MSNLLNPLESILQQAAKLPESGAIEPYAQRLNTKTSGISIILLDISGSMAEVLELGRRKIDLLRQALERSLHSNEVAIAFHSIPVQLESLHKIPEPDGGTALHYAIAQAIPYKPNQTLVISDGKPDDPKQAVAQAEKLTGIINTLYIGSDQDGEAIAFMSQLARLGCGRAENCDISNPRNQPLLKENIKHLLTGEAG